MNHSEQLARSVELLVGFSDNDDYCKVELKGTPVFGANVVYLVIFVLMSISALLMPFLYVLRYRYYRRQFAMTAYQKRFQIGWPLMTVGAELTCVGGAICMVWLQQWPPLGQDQWLILTGGIISSGLLCVFAAQVMLAEGFQFLRVRSRHIATNH